jgi:hypothetical protein
MMSSNLAMSDRRVPRHRAFGTVDLRGPADFPKPATDQPHGTPPRSLTMHIHNTGYEPVRDGPANGDQDRERRLELLVRRLPERLQTVVRWLRWPAARWVRIPAGLLLIVASLFSILPILGLWMLPLGLVLLAEDVPPVRRATGRVLAWIERRRRRWMGLPQASHRQSISSVAAMDRLSSKTHAASGDYSPHSGSSSP